MARSWASFAWISACSTRFSASEACDSALSAKAVATSARLFASSARRSALSSKSLWAAIAAALTPVPFEMPHVTH
jgi:hypothetical protein